MEYNRPERKGICLMNNRCPFIITKELEEGRARLEAFRNKIQPYPAFTEQSGDVPPRPYQEVKIHTVRVNTTLYPRIGQLQNEIDEINNAIKVLLKRIYSLDKKKSKYT